MIRKNDNNQPKVAGTPLPGVDTYRCGHEKWNGSWKSYTLCDDCVDCRDSVVGTRQTVIRYGNVPSSGMSHNYRDNCDEVGVSVYLPWQRPRAEFVRRQKYTLSAVVIGWGSDDEALIDASTIE